jgi:hypothetical protein
MTDVIPHGQCTYRGPENRCPKPATRHVDSRALGRPDAGLMVCEEHYQEVKAYWLDQGEARAKEAEPG